MSNKWENYYQMLMTPKSFLKSLSWLWTAVDHFRSGILGEVSGDHSSETFEPLWDKVSAWKCYF
jgi:IS1 family transposase